MIKFVWLILVVKLDFLVRPMSKQPVSSFRSLSLNEAALLYIQLEQGKIGCRVD